MTMEMAGDIIEFIGGLGMFLYGMNVMADALQRSASGKMKKLLGYLTNNRFLGVIFGAVITAIIQSSSATTVMVVGFVNAGIISLVQAVGVIMGANIGTTITAWIVSMSEWGSIFQPEFFSPLLVGIGVFFIMFCRKQKWKEVGQILVGFGVLFIGLSFMSGSIEAYRDSPIFSQAFSVLGNNPLLAILTGTVVTGIIQSSSASVGILQTLAMNGVVNWRSAIFITLGQNIGTCVTALISCAGANKNAKRAAVIHLLFNVMGAIVFGAVMYVIFLLNQEFAKSTISTVQISIFHTIFNVANTILLFPFVKQLVYLSEKIITDKLKEGEKENDVEVMKRVLDERIMENPSFAIEAVNREVVQMGTIVTKSAKKAYAGLIDKDKSAIDFVLKKEAIINDLEKVLTEYLVRVDNLSLSVQQHNQVKNLLYTIHDIERIGDHLENIAEFAQKRYEMSLKFSKTGQKDLELIFSEVLSSLKNAVKARDLMDLQAVNKVNESEKIVDKLEEDLREKHIVRLSKGKCNTESGLIFLDTITNLERISDHAHNIVEYVKKEL